MTQVDEAYQRYFYLTDALGRLVRSAVSKPISDENLRLGLIEAGDTPSDAKAKIIQRLDYTRDRVAELALVDMCAAFENDCRKRIPTAIGEARRVLDKHYNVRTMSQLRKQLVRQAEDFGTLETIFRLVEPYMSSESAVRLRSLRDARNRAAHCSASLRSLPLQLEDARDLLNNVLALIF